MMSSKKDYLSKYYGKDGDYLEHHEEFLSAANIKKDVAFLVKVLELDKNDKILDIACGQGRHVVALAESGYSVDGVDFSSYLLDKAKESVAKLDIVAKPEFFVSDVMTLKLEKKYNKMYWFFSDLANINVEKAVKSICNCMSKNGIFVVDVDNVFRIILHLLKNPKSRFSFNAEKLELVDSLNNLTIPYPVFSLWKQWFKEEGCEIEGLYGDYDFSEYSINSQRLIIKVKKTT